jgi:hypothetical protein
MEARGLREREARLQSGLRDPGMRIGHHRSIRRLSGLRCTIAREDVRSLPCARCERPAVCLLGSGCAASLQPPGNCRSERVTRRAVAVASSRRRSPIGCGGGEPASPRTNGCASTPSVYSSVRSSRSRFDAVFGAARSPASPNQVLRDDDGALTASSCPALSTTRMRDSLFTCRAGQRRGKAPPS